MIQPSSAAQRWYLSSPIPGWLCDHNGSGFYLITKKNITPLERVSVSSIPASSHFDPFCRWACLSSIPPPSFCAHKSLLLSSCNVDFPFTSFRIHIVLSSLQLWTSDLQPAPAEDRRSICRIGAWALKGTWPQTLHRAARQPEIRALLLKINLPWSSRGSTRGKSFIPITPPPFRERHA